MYSNKVVLALFCKYGVIVMFSRTPYAYGSYVTQQNLHNLLAYSKKKLCMIYWAIIKFKYQKSSTLTKGKCPMHERVIFSFATNN